MDGDRCDFLICQPNPSNVPPISVVPFNLSTSRLSAPDTGPHHNQDIADLPISQLLQTSFAITLGSVIVDAPFLQSPKHRRTVTSPPIRYQLESHNLPYHDHDETSVAESLRSSLHIIRSLTSRLAQLLTLCATRKSCPPKVTFRSRPPPQLLSGWPCYGRPDSLWHPSWSTNPQS